MNAIPQTETDKIIAELSRRLDEAAIDQLREHVARLSQRVEELECQLDRAVDEAGYWLDQYSDLKAATGECVQTGITRDGQIGVMK
jgi:hypothetical protein